MQTPFNEVLTVIEAYFDMLYESDATKIPELFHEKALYATAAEGSLYHLTMDHYVKVVAARQSPKSRGEARRDEVEEIAFAGPVTATARLRCAIGRKHFTDCLAFVKLDGRWWIMSKVFHYDVLPE
ncbi:MAG: nuclear transport factor 2 family protein [Aestuariivirga sp.]